MSFLTEQPPCGEPEYRPKTWARNLGRTVTVAESSALYEGTFEDYGVCRVFYAMGPTGAQVITYAEPMLDFRARELLSGLLADLMIGKVCERMPLTMGEVVVNGLPRQAMVLRLVSRRLFQEHFTLTGKAVLYEDRTVMVLAPEEQASYLKLVSEAP